MAYQEVTTTGYGTRVGRSFKSIGTGFLLFIAATALLWWNEGRAVKTEKMLDEAGNAYVEMENPNKKDASLDGELICGTAMATTEDSLSDAQYGIGAKAISLQRKVEYYQWVEESKEETEDKLGGKEVKTTTYTYSKDWVGSPIESSKFHDPAYQDKNTVLILVEPEDKWAENVKFGAYMLNENLIHCISSHEPMDLSAIDSLQIVKWNKDIQQVVARQIGGKTDSLKLVHINNNEIYYGYSPSSPNVGDVRVTFEKVVPAKVTVMAVLDGDTFKAFKAKNGKRFQTLVMGKKTGDEIIDAEKEANNMWLWILRILGISLVIAGLKGIFGFIETILKVVPFIAGIFGWGVGVVCTVVGVVWSFIVIALAWLFYRPLLAICLLAIAAFLIWVFAFKGKDKLKELAAKARKTEPAATNNIEKV